MSFLKLLALSVTDFTLPSSKLIVLEVSDDDMAGFCIRNISNYAFSTFPWATKTKITINIKSVVVLGPSIMTSWPRKER